MSSQQKENFLPGDLVRLTVGKVKYAQYIFTVISVTGGSGMGFGNGPNYEVYHPDLGIRSSHDYYMAFRKI